MIDGKYMPENAVRKWLLNCALGKVTSEELEAAKMAEVNANDMMLNTGIFYHPESISECQLLVLLIAWSYLNLPIKDHMLEH